MTQNDRILQHLKEGKEITPLEALEYFGCFRLSARINDLRNLGYDIKTANVKNNGKTYAKYWIPMKKQIEFYGF